MNRLGKGGQESIRSPSGVRQAGVRQAGVRQAGVRQAGVYLIYAGINITFTTESYSTYSYEMLSIP